MDVKTTSTNICWEGREEEEEEEERLKMKRKSRGHGCSTSRARLPRRQMYFFCAIWEARCISAQFVLLAVYVPQASPICPTAGRRC